MEFVYSSEDDSYESSFINDDDSLSSSTRSSEPPARKVSKISIYILSAIKISQK